VYLDQVLYAMIDVDWRQTRETQSTASVRVH
jgi:hypothetical protein